MIMLLPVSCVLGLLFEIDLLAFSVAKNEFV